MSLRNSLFRQLQAVARNVFADADAYPMGALPKKPPQHFITFQRVSNVHHRHLLGGSGIAASRWQIDCWARYAADADKLYEAVRKSTDNLTGSIGVAGSLTNIEVTFLEGDTEEFVPPVDGSQTGRARVRMDVLIWAPETVTPG